MKKYKKIAYMSLIVLILLAGFFIYKVLGKNDGNEYRSEIFGREIYWVI